MNQVFVSHPSIRRAACTAMEDDYSTYRSGDEKHRGDMQQSETIVMPT